jgi:hypothetical protein
MNYRFTSAALSQAPGSAAATDSLLSANHGSGLWGGAGGTGANTVTIVTQTAQAVRIPSVNVQVKNLSGGIIAQCTTDANGDGTVNINSATYDFVAAKDQYTMSTTQQVIPSGGLTVTILGVAVTTVVTSGTPAITVLDIIKRALRLLGVFATNKSPDSPEARDAFTVLNSMIYQWNNEKLSLYAMKNELFSVVSGTGAYTIGDGGDWNTTRPEKIEKMFLRDTASGVNIDFKIELLNNDRYQEIFQKSLQSTYPRYAYYQPDYPLGTVTFWPTPTKAFSAGVSQWGLLSAFTSLSQTVLLPPGYEMALGYALAYHIAHEYGIDPMQFDRQMKDAKANIATVNTEVLLMSSDSFVLPKTVYNIYSDRL